MITYIKVPNNNNKKYNRRYIIISYNIIYVDTLLHITTETIPINVNNKYIIHTRFEIFGFI